MTLLQLQDLTYRYKNTAEAVLYQINYNFEPGKFYSIIGESGAGKSTLLSLLAGLDSPVEGSILFQGEDIRKKGYSYHRMHHISLVSEAPVILADEPTGNLDPKTAGDIVELLKSLAQKTGKCVIVVTHSKEVAQASDITLELKDKKLTETRNTTK